MQITHRFRLYPNKIQKENMLKTLDLCRQTYNMLLAEFDDWDNISKYELQWVCTLISNPHINSFIILKV